MWVVTELAIVASDVPEVIGTALALKLIFGVPTWIGIIITSASTLAGGLLRTSTRPTLNRRSSRRSSPRVCMSIHTEGCHAPILVECSF